MNALLFLLLVGLAQFHDAGIPARLVRTWCNRAERRGLSRRNKVQWTWLVVLIMLAACGPVPAAPEVIKEPNTVQACDRALECAIITDDQSAQCVACLEHVRPVYAKLAEGETIETVTCDRLRELLAFDESDSFPKCVAEGWKWNR